MPDNARLTGRYLLYVKTVLIFSVVMLNQSSILRGSEAVYEGYEKHGNSCFSKGSADVEKVALTFDDGPDGMYTLKIVEYLKEREIPATFFFLGQRIEQFSGIAAIVHEAGFEIGSHSYDHSRLTTLSSEEIEEQLTITKEVLEELTGEKCMLMRPPYGAFDSRLLSLTQRNELVPVLWSIDSEDWKNYIPEDEIVKRIREELKPGSIILLHSTREKTLQMLPKIVDTVTSRGYSFCTVSEMIVDIEIEKMRRFLGEHVEDCLKKCFSQ